MFGSESTAMNKIKALLLQSCQSSGKVWKAFPLQNPDSQEEKNVMEIKRKNLKRAITRNHFKN